MMMGTTSNLPAILHFAYHYDSPEYVCYITDLPAWLQPSINSVWKAMDSPPPTQLIITMRTLMLLIYFPLCAFAAIFAAINDRRRDPRLAIAIGLPWLMFYSLPLQIHERYLLFYSACAAILVAAGVRFGLLGFLGTLAGLAATMHSSFAANGIPRRRNGQPSTLWATLHQLVAGTHPGIAWLVLLALTVFLYSIVAPTRPTGSLIDDRHL